MIDTRKFLEAVADFGARDGEKSSARIPRLAVVDPAYMSGKPKVTFEGSTNLSPNGFVCLADYAPAAGDRVLVLPVGNTYVILNKLAP